jgi:hypothetical protein
MVTSRLYFLDTHERRAENGCVVRVSKLVTLAAGSASTAGLVVSLGASLVVSLGASLGGIGCRGSAGDAAPPCSAVAARFHEIAKYELVTAKVDEATARAVSDQLPAIRDALALACTAGKWSEAIRKCLVRANDHDGVEACEQQLTDEQRRDLDRATRGNPETP